MKRKKLSIAIFFLSIFVLSELIVNSEAKLEHKKEDIEESNIIKNNDYENLNIIIVDAMSDGEEYISIQQAIDDADDGATVYVKSGTYCEILNIYKKIRLIGEDRENTFIKAESDKNGYAIKISSSDVTIGGISITNQGSGLYTTGIKVVGTRTIIKDCIINNTPVGIAVWSSSNKISNCSFFNCEDEGIAFLGSTYSDCNENIVTDCEFTNNCDGIELQYSSNNEIIRCDFNKNTHAGIDAIGSENDGNIISNCIFSNNKVFGIYFTRSSDIFINSCKMSEDQIMFNSVGDSIIKSCDVESLYLLNSQIELKDCEDVEITKIKNINSECSIDGTEIVKDDVAKGNIEKNRELLFSILSFIRSKIVGILERVTGK